MNITSLTDDYTWDLIPCDEHLAGYSGCELPDKAGNVSIPFSFLLRSKDQRSTTKGHNCGRMNITSLTDDYTWDLIPCDKHLAGYSGCELPDKAGNVSIPFSFLLRSKDQPSTTKGPRARDTTVAE